MRDLFSTEQAGCTATVALVTPTHIIVANVGDSRCVLSTATQVSALTEDHKPQMPAERARIEAAGGTVVNSRGTFRVNGILAVSRALGDFSLKANLLLPPEQQPVTPQPECHVHKRGGTSSTPRHLLCHARLEMLPCCLLTLRLSVLPHSFFHVKPRTLSLEVLCRARCISCCHRVRWRRVVGFVFRWGLGRYEQCRSC